MLIPFVLFGNLKKCQTVVKTLSIILAAILLAAGIAAIVDLISVGGYEKVPALITDYDYNIGRENEWTDIQYQVNGEDYTFRLSYYKTLYDKGDMIDIYADPQHPKDIIMADKVFTVSKMILIFAIPVGFFDLIYLINYAVIKRSHKKQQARLAAQLNQMNSGMS